MNTEKTYTVEKYQGSKRENTLHLPSSKSLANRSLILAAQIEASFILEGDFEAEDIQLMISALRSLGITISEEKGLLLIENDMSWKESEEDREIFLGNSGTSIRFLSSLVPLRKGKTLLTGIQRMREERPIKDMSDALVQLGVKVRFLEKEGFPPVEYSLEEQISSEVCIKGETSSQYFSSLLLSAASYPMGMKIKINGDLISKPYIELTLNLLREWGLICHEEGDTYHIDPQEIVAQDRVVEGDASAAVYWWAFNYLQETQIDFKNLSKESVQGDMKFQEVLEELRLHKEGTYERDMNDMPDASMMLMALAPVLDFPVMIRNVASLRVKETDRLQAMATELHKLGVKLDVGSDYIYIDAATFENPSELIEIDTYDDHRMAMCFAILGSKIGNLSIKDPNCVKKTYPLFWDHLSEVMETKE